MFHHLDRFAAEDFLQQGFGQDEPLGPAFYPLFVFRKGMLDGHVIDLRANRYCHVGGQCPGSGGPDQQRGAGLSTSGMRTKTDGSVASA